MLQLLYKRYIVWGKIVYVLVRVSFVGFLRSVRKMHIFGKNSIQMFTFALGAKLKPIQAFRPNKQEKQIDIKWLLWHMFSLNSPLLNCFYFKQNRGTKERTPSSRHIFIAFLANIYYTFVEQFTLSLCNLVMFAFIAPHQG